MAGRSWLSATPEPVAALRELARSEIRGEADRARAIWLTLAGWTGVERAQAFGVAMLRSAPTPGPSPWKGEKALAVARELLSEPVENRPNWTRPRRQAEIERRAGLSISTSRRSVRLREKRGSPGGGPDTA